jgi:hypothetical protein
MNACLRTNKAKQWNSCRKAVESRGGYRTMRTAGAFSLPDCNQTKAR